MTKYDPKFYTQCGRLNRYALACGYIERAESEMDGEYRSVVLEMSGSVIQVKTYIRSSGYRGQFGTNKITIARKVFAQECSRYGVKFNGKVPHV